MLTQSLSLKVTQRAQPYLTLALEKSVGRLLNIGFSSVLQGDLPGWLAIWPALPFTVGSEPGPCAESLRVTGSRWDSPARSWALSRWASWLPQEPHPRRTGWKWGLFYTQSRWPVGHSPSGLLWLLTEKMLCLNVSPECCAHCFLVLLSSVIFIWAVL